MGPITRIALAHAGRGARYSAAYLRQHCSHPRTVQRKHEDDCWWTVCAVCGQRGPRKHSRPLARARFRSVGTQFRGRTQRVRYTGTAARDDSRFQTKRGKQ